MVTVGWGGHTTHHIMKGKSGAEYKIDYRPGNNDEAEAGTIVWIWEYVFGSGHQTVALYRMRGSIEQQVNALVKLAKDYNNATVRVDITHAGTATVDILEENGVKTEKYYTVSHVGQRK